MLLVSSTGCTWALLCLWLAHTGHAPSRVLVPIAREHYYFAQAAFVLPVMFAQWSLCALVATGVARTLGGLGSTQQTKAALAPALCLPLLVLLIVPDLVVFALLDFAALGKLVRVTAPLSFLGSLLWSTRALANVHALAPLRALVAALAGLLTQAAAGALLLR